MRSFMNPLCTCLLMRRWSFSCPSCTTTRFVLGHLDFPYKLILDATDAPASAQPVLDGQGVPASVADGVGLEGSLAICSFAAAHARKGIVPPATGRPDVTEWLSEAAAGTSQLDALADGESALVR